MHPSEHALLEWLDRAPNRERTQDFRGMRLDEVRRVLARLPAPPAPLTVAGTKGKGSTVRLAECALLAGGRRSLAFTSPHLRSVAERWRIDGAPAPWPMIEAAALATADAEAAAGIRLSWFERTTAMAVAMAGMIPDVRLILEVGIGGRLDAVNAIDPAVAAVTHLSFDHRDVLGSTLEHIAGEKLGISRPGRPLVIGPQTVEGALAVRRRLPAGVAAVWAQPDSRQPGLRGDHQRDNAGTARAALHAFDPSLAEDAIDRGFAAADLEARCQTVAWQGRTLLIDGAHNGPSVAATLAVAGGALRPGFTVVLGTAKDKEIDAILAALPVGTRLIRCGYDSPRARGPGDWPAIAQDTPWAPSVAAVLAAPPAGDLCITGSFYVAGEALAVVDA
jgi:dihydrofolate synthase/folylpolyglutamate synthase